MKRLGFLFFIIVIILTFVSNTVYNLMIPNVKICEFKSGKIQKELKEQAVCKSLESKIIYSNKDKIVKKINFKDNQEIKKGDIILEFETDDRVYELKNLKIEYERCQNDKKKYLSLREENIKEDPNIKILENKINNLKEDIAKNKILYDNDAISKDTLEGFQENIKNTSLELKKEKKDYKKENIELDYNIKECELNALSYMLKIEKLEKEIKEDNMLIAKEDTKLQKIYVNQGQMVNINEPIIEIRTNEKKNTYEVNFLLDEDEVKLVNIGDEVNISYFLKQNKIKKGKVIAINNIGDINNTKEVKIEFSSDDDINKQVVNLEIKNESPYYDYIVPSSALKYDGKNYYILKINKEENVISKKYKTIKLKVFILDRNDEYIALKPRNNMDGKIIESSNAIVKENEEVYIMEES